ncbi:MAG: isochorismatase family protein [Desulfonatronovibrio sp.]
MLNNFNSDDLLLIIDVQKDFCPGGAMAVEGGHEIIPVLNKWIESALDNEIPVYASRDWHPKNDISFREYGGSWPPHCLQDSEGARFHPDLKLPGSVIKVTKGVRFDHDQKSAFDKTGLAALLRKLGIKRLWIGGLALDVCVLASALDARQEGFEVMLIKDATRAVTTDGGEKALEKIYEAGVQLAVQDSVPQRKPRK